MRTAKCLCGIFLVYIIIFMAFSNSYALEKATHQVINEYIAENTIREFSLDQYLFKQLGFQDGKDEEFTKLGGIIFFDKTQKIFEWLGYGGIKEDSLISNARFLRHFHDPLKPWDIAGLKSSRLGRSSIIWAQTNQFRDHYSWNDIRTYYYLALCETDKDKRNDYFAETFRGLGQQMHLIEDASVPLHVRDDAHPIAYNYEKWVEKFRTNEKISQNQIDFNKWLSNSTRYGYDKSVLNIIPKDPVWNVIPGDPYWGIPSINISNDLAPVPIARIVDTDQYTGDNPEITKSGPIGLAEYTNANYLSGGTIPGTIMDGGYTYPEVPDIDIKDYEIYYSGETSEPLTRTYFETGDENDVDGKYRLATVPMFLAIYNQQLQEYSKYILPPSLDNNVYHDYAERLIPRAVGYASGLLEYFFRGKMQTDRCFPIANDNGIFGLIMKIKNITPSKEIMSNGYFYVVVQYTPEDGSEDILVCSYPQRKQISDSWFVSDITEIPYGGEGVQLRFVFPSYIPKTYKSIKYTLVFLGDLGEEITIVDEGNIIRKTGAVIGKSDTPGEIIFDEPWDIEGTLWEHTANYDEAGNKVINTVNNSILIKENIRAKGQKTGQINESILNLQGLLITPNTFIRFKVDEFSANGYTPAATYDFQYLCLEFNNGCRIKFSPVDQGIGYYFMFDPEYVCLDRIYRLLELRYPSSTMPESLYLEKISIIQQLMPLDEVSTIQHEQRIKFDYIHIMEGQ